MFHSARIKLTLLYTLILFMVSFTFSIAIYRVQVGEMERFERQQKKRVERMMESGFIPEFPMRESPELLKEAQERIVVSLLIINIFIVTTGAGLGYFLAGKTLRPIEEMIEEQKRFISDASHELKTPLTSLKTAFEVFLRSKNKNGVTTLITESIVEVDRLTMLTENMLELARFDGNPKPAKFEKILLNEIIKKAITIVAPLAKAKEISINSNLAEATILGNKDDICQLMVVLLDNAIKYSNAKEKVDVVLKKEKDTAWVLVTDHGVGIPEKDIPHIFDRFYRANVSRGGKTRGFGLGLSIAKKIADAHNASIIVKRKGGEGTTFQVIFRLQKVS